MTAILGGVKSEEARRFSVKCFCENMHVFAADDRANGHLAKYQANGTAVTAARVKWGVLEKSAPPRSGIKSLVFNGNLFYSF